MNLEIDVKSIIISKLKHSLYIVVALLLGETWENLENLGRSLVMGSWFLRGLLPLCNVDPLIVNSGPVSNPEFWKSLTL